MFYNLCTGAYEVMQVIKKIKIKQGWGKKCYGKSKKNEEKKTATDMHSSQYMNTTPDW